jgi:hypothetical protein
MLIVHSIGRWRVLTAAFGCFAASSVLAQSATAPAAASPQPPYKEVQVDANAFVRGDPVPAWVRPADVPPTTRRNPVVVRLWDTELHVDSTPTVFVQRAIQVNDSASLGRIGEFTVQYMPQYQSLHLHSVKLLRAGAQLDRTAEAGVRFLQRETGLESGSYSGAVTASFLLSDVRVGDTLVVSYSVVGDNPVFGSTYGAVVGWDRAEPTETQRVILNYPLTRRIAWKFFGDHGGTDLKPAATEDRGWRRLVFEQHAVQGIDLEPGVPNDYFAYRFLQFSEYAVKLPWRYGESSNPDGGCDSAVGHECPFSRGDPLRSAQPRRETFVGARVSNNCDWPAARHPRPCEGGVLV